MIFQDAINILNRERHQGFDQWEAVTSCADHNGDRNVWARGPTACGYTEWEAVAIAEKYERDAAKATVG